MKKHFYALTGILFLLGCSPVEPGLREQKIDLITSDVWMNENATSENGEPTIQYKDLMIVFRKNKHGVFDGDYYTYSEEGEIKIAGNWRLTSDLSSIDLNQEENIKATLTDQSLSLHFTSTETHAGDQGVLKPFSVTLTLRD